MKKLIMAALILAALLVGIGCKADSQTSSEEPVWHWLQIEEGVVWRIAVEDRIFHITVETRHDEGRVLKKILVNGWQLCAATQTEKGWVVVDDDAPPNLDQFRCLDGGGNIDVGPFPAGAEVEREEVAPPRRPLPQHQA